MHQSRTKGGYVRGICAIGRGVMSKEPRRKGVGVGLNHAGEVRLSQAVGYINTGFVRALLAQKVTFGREGD